MKAFRIGAEPDLHKLEARGFHVIEEFNDDTIDGMNAILRIDPEFRIEIYQGCNGRYELQGQGRGRPKQYVLVALDWYSPFWYIEKLVKGSWTELAKGQAQSAEAAVEGALAHLNEHFPSLAVLANHRLSLPQ